MSLEEEGSLTWLWRGVEIEGISKEGLTICFESKCIDSPTFHYQGIEWHLQCETFLHRITLSLRCKDLSTPPPLSLLVSLEVWGGTEPDCTNIRHTERELEVDDWYSNMYIIWEQGFRDLQKIFPAFSRNALLTFRIQLTQIDNCASPVRSTLAFRYRRIQPHSKTFVDVSVQTDLTANSISSLDSLSEDIAKMLDMDSNPDVELHCDGNTTKVHRALLSMRSPVLAKMHQTEVVGMNTGVVNIRNMSAETFRFFLKYLHSGKLEQEALTFDLALHLYKAGEMYEVKSLSRLCAQFLIQNLTVDNACDVLVVVAAHSDSDLEGKVTTYIVEKEIPLTNDLWSGFCNEHTKLANKVYKKMISKLSQHRQGFLKNK